MTSVSVTCSFGCYQPLPKKRRRKVKTPDPNLAAQKKFKAAMKKRIKGIYHATKKTIDKTGSVLGLLVGLYGIGSTVWTHMPVAHHLAVALLQH